MKVRIENVLQLSREAFGQIKGSEEIHVVPMEGHGKLSLRVGDKFYDIKVPESGILTWDEVKRQMSKIDQLQGGSVDGGDSALDERIEKP